LCIARNARADQADLLNYFTVARESSRREARASWTGKARRVGRVGWAHRSINGKRDLALGLQRFGKRIKLPENIERLLDECCSWRLCQKPGFAAAMTSTVKVIHVAGTNARISLRHDRFRSPARMDIATGRFTLLTSSRSRSIRVSAT